MTSPVNSTDDILSSEAAAKRLSPEDLKFPPGFGFTALYGHDKHAVPVVAFEHATPAATTVPATATVPTATTDPSSSRIINPRWESAAAAAATAREVIDHR